MRKKWEAALGWQKGRYHYISCAADPGASKQLNHGKLQEAEGGEETQITETDGFPDGFQCFIKTFLSYQNLVPKFLMCFSLNLIFFTLGFSKITGVNK